MPRDVLTRPPRLEEHACDPTAGRLDRPRRGRCRPGRVSERRGRLDRPEGEVGVRYGHCSAERRGRPERDVRLAAADENHPHRRWRVAHERGDDGERLGRLGNPLDLVDDKDKRRVADRLGEQAGGLGVG